MNLGTRIVFGLIAVLAGYAVERWTSVRNDRVEPIGAADPVADESGASVVLTKHDLPDARATDGRLPSTLRYCIKEIYSVRRHQFPDLLQRFRARFGQSHFKGIAVPLIFERWVQLDPASALANLQDPYDLALRNRLIDAAVADDPAQAFRRVSEIQNRQRRATLLREFLEALASVSPELLVEFAGTLDALEDRDVLDGMAKHLASTTPGVALRLLDLFPESESKDSPRSGLIMHSFQTLADMDPQSAVDLAESLEAPGDREFAHKGIARAWGRRDSLGLLQWLEKEPSNRLKTNYLLAAIDDRPENSVEALRSLELANAIPFHYDRTGALGTTAAYWFQHEPDSALAWIDENLEGRARWVAIGRMISSELPDAFPVASLASYASEMPWVRGDSHLFAMRWAIKSPEAAAAWAVDGNERHLGRVMNTWVQGDSQAAADFIRSITDEKTKRIAANAVLNELPGEQALEFSKSFNFEFRDSLSSYRKLVKKLQEQKGAP